MISNEYKSAVMERFEVPGALDINDYVENLVCNEENRYFKRKGKYKNLFCYSY